MGSVLNVGVQVPGKGIVSIPCVAVPRVGDMLWLFSPYLEGTGRHDRLVLIVTYIVWSHSRITSADGKNPPLVPLGPEVHTRTATAQEVNDVLKEAD